ncbi:DeoR/GlpR family DNA-binding transcription regulator [Agromyces aerolatus]|uniref:DeoR/GlpR family DNA-binding transcription regulator n=1 Tax=Agromyces sp. LY-1074 TaxID=3074080 RepID=UPI00285B86F4|nr:MULTISPECIES: DeoR/GlpR family DNA-binding transcription regulator [unclassified Agromyces]MDR5700891.1 DeoR/GlpR family DNA-binding transcription regulator [Agromyces sp. LY-1074]MDR5707448.1 DeoR/GlpR family DNA-binding transcription regulator [Agromyces sp. LY-1358]
MSPDDGAPARSKHPDERHRAILTTLREAGRVDSEEMARQLGVTGETVRKDLIRLESLGRLRRVRGGAALPESISYEAEVSLRLEFSHEKSRIAVAALDRIPVAGAIYIDAGSTTERFASRIPPQRELTVYTHALSVANAVIDHPRLEVYLLGGRLRRTTLANVGSATEHALAEVNVDVAFLGTNGISATRGLTTPDPEEASVKRAVLSSARERVLLCDHSKFGVVSGMQHATLDDLDVLITDREPPAELQRALDRSGVRCEVVQAAG